MGLFVDHITSQDDIVLAQYNFCKSYDYEKIMVLEEKQPDGATYFDWSWYYRKVFVPLDIVWKYYLKESVGDIKNIYGMNKMPAKKDFTDFAQTFNHSEIRKIIFHQEIYIDRSTLKPIFDAFNVYWVSYYYRNEETCEF